MRLEREVQFLFYPTSELGTGSVAHTRTVHDGGVLLFFRDTQQAGTESGCMIRNKDKVPIDSLRYNRPQTFMAGDSIRV